MNALTRAYLAHSAAAGGSLAADGVSTRLRRMFVPAYLNRPAFLEADQLRAVAPRVTELWRLMRSLPGRLAGGDVERFADLYHVTPRQREAVLATWPSQGVGFGRGDLFQTSGGFRLLEMNMVAVGAAEIAELADATAGAGQVRTFVRERGLVRTDPMRALCAGVKRLIRDSGLPADTRVVLVSPAGESVRNDTSMAYIATLLRDYGLTAADARLPDIVYRDGRPYAGGEPIDVALRYFLIEDVDDDDRWRHIQPLAQAHAAGKVVLATPFEADLCGSKRSLGLLWDPRFADRFSTAERDLVTAFVPWTAVLADRIATPGGPADALGFCVSHQAGLVFKPGMSNCGHGVVIGREVSAALWREIVRGGIERGDVVQAAVEPVEEEFQEGERQDVVHRRINWGMFVADDGYAGVVVRGQLADRGLMVTTETGALLGCCFEEPL